MDDFCVTEEKHKAYRRVLADIRQKYQAKDLGVVRRLLGWSVRPLGENGLHLFQPYLAQSLVDLVQTIHERTVRTTCFAVLDISPAHPGETILQDKQQLITSAVDMLRYLADSTRADLAFVTVALAWCTKAPKWIHWRQIVQVARYVSRTLHYYLAYHHEKPVLRAQIDADFAGCSRTRRYMMGSLVYLDDSLISWQAKRIRTVATNTCAAEYIAANKTEEEVKWLRTPLEELRQRRLPTTLLEVDNMAVIAVASVREKTRCSKYIDVHHHNVRDKVQRGEVNIKNTPLAILPADALTKPLPVMQFVKNCAAMGMRMWKADKMTTAVEAS